MSSPVSAGFISTSKFVNCLPPESSHYFTHQNHSRSHVFFFDAGSIGEAIDGQCRLEDFAKSPRPPGAETSVGVACTFRSPKTTSYIRRCVKIRIEKIDPLDQRGVTEEQRLCIEGNIGEKCAVESEKASALPIKPPETDLSALSCKSFRIDLPPSPLFRVDIRDQREVGACYAAVASTLFDYARAEEGDPLIEKTSTLASAVDHKNYLDRRPTQGPKILDGGDASELLELLLADGACPDSGVRRRLRAEKVTEDELNLLYSYFVDGLDSIRRKKQTLPSSRGDELEPFRQCLGGYPSEVSKRIAATSVEPCNARAFVSLTDSLIHSAPMIACGNTLKFLNDQLSLGCPEIERMKLKKRWRVENIRFSAQPMEKKMAAFDRAFVNVRKRRPVAVTLPACILGGEIAKEEVKDFLSSKKCIDRHEMIAVGQKWNPIRKRCDVILRNSWGKAPCTTYDGLDCFPEMGTVSVDKQVFIEGLRAITRVSPAE